MSLFWRAMYSAFSKPLWGLCLSWITISCYYGYGGLINSFMSWPGWTPLGRLTYSAYLIHLIVVTYLLIIHPSEIVWGSYTDIFSNFIVPSVVITYVLAILWSSCFEVAMGKVEIILIGGRRRAVDPAKKRDEIGGDEQMGNGHQNGLSNGHTIKTAPIASKDEAWS